MTEVLAPALEDYTCNGCGAHDCPILIDWDGIMLCEACDNAERKAQIAEGFMDPSSDGDLPPEPAAAEGEVSTQEDELFEFLCRTFKSNLYDHPHKAVSVSNERVIAQFAGAAAEALVEAGYFSTDAVGMEAEGRNKPILPIRVTTPETGLREAVIEQLVLNGSDWKLAAGFLVWAFDKGMDLRECKEAIEVLRLATLSKGEGA